MKHLRHYQRKGWDIICLHFSKSENLLIFFYFPLPSPTNSRSDLVKVGSEQTSGQTSGDELETTTSSDIEIISRYRLGFCFVFRNVFEMFSKFKTICFFVFPVRTVIAAAQHHVTVRQNYYIIIIRNRNYHWWRSIF